jgi:hypothetical protein
MVIIVGVLHSVAKPHRVTHADHIDKCASSQQRVLDYWRAPSIVVPYKVKGITKPH